ncbi:MAG: beta-lactamase family protein [Defluviitaleaceae bacterium]|nr:beta-lactamase family protein [Defluviitaleaceae bacterium]
MRKNVATTLLVFLLILGASLPIYAMSLPDEQSTAIQSFVEEARRISRTPGISVAVVVGSETHFFSAGVANRETETPANEDTLWDIGSSTKAFTSLGILYLEEQGLLSLDDSIADYLPWLVLRYSGQPVDMQEVRLYHFMHHISGLPMDLGSSTGSLRQGVENMVDVGLVFLPGEGFIYANVNTNILGLVIEAVSGHSYESFMVQHIFHPLGMMDTFANRERAIATGRRAQGYVTQFIFFTMQSDVSNAEAVDHMPAGYIVSSTRDMARWMEVQLGLATDIPEVFQTIIPRSHEAGRSIAEPDGSYYAAGWIVSADQSFIEHGGTTEGFGSNVFLFPEEQIGITVLSNLSGAHGTQSRPAGNIKDILDGNLNQSYSILWTFQHLDVTFTIATVLGTVLAVFFILFALHRHKHNERCTFTKKRIALIAFWIVMVLALGTPFLLFPWFTFIIGRIYSLLTMIIALGLLFGSIAWFVSSPRRSK